MVHSLENKANTITRAETNDGKLFPNYACPSWRQLKQCSTVIYYSLLNQFVWSVWHYKLYTVVVYAHKVQHVVSVGCVWGLISIFFYIVMVYVVSLMYSCIYIYTLLISMLYNVVHGGCVSSCIHVFYIYRFICCKALKYI